MPTLQPRYTVTDTGEMREMLDLAQRRWPGIQDRRQLLLRLAATGRDAIAREVGAADGEGRRQRQEQALALARTLIDVDGLLADAAWR